MNFDMMHPADQIVTIMQRLYNYGMTTTSGGNLSIMDSDGVMWISPAGIDKGSLTRDDIVKVLPDGTIEGRHKPSSEYPFHHSIYKKRPDLKAVLHAHPPALVAYSCVRQIPDTTLIPNAQIICKEIKLAPYALPGSQLLGDRISKEFEAGCNTVMLENHGVVIGAESLFRAFVVFETLDYLCRLQVNASRIGTPKGISAKHLEIYKQKTHPITEEFTVDVHSAEELQLRRDICNLIRRGYDNRLFTSEQGTFSARLSDGTFIITPYNKDRKYLEPEDLVLIKDGKKEAGKIPSRSVNLHEAIYKHHKDINAVILAHPPAIMAFAVTDAVFDARLIPESYIMLRTVKKYPFGCSFMQPDKTAMEISLQNPVAIVENDCVLVAGVNLINAFDRLEVMDYSARSCIDTYNIGKIVKISDEEVEEIEEAFNLK